MSYESAPLRRFKCRYNSDNDDNELLFQLVRKGVKVTPASATIAIYQPGNSTAVLDATSMGSPSGTLFTYAIDTTTTADYPIGTGYRARIVVTDANSVTYDEDIYFDVVRNVPSGKISRDQLVALDDRIVGASHAGDSDFSEVIQATWDEVQFDIETRSVEGGQLLEDMIVDRSRLSVAVRFLVLARILRPKGEAEDAEYYEDKYSEKMRQLLTGIPMDVNQDGEEDSEQANANVIRLVN